MVMSPSEYLEGLARVADKVICYRYDDSYRKRDQQLKAETMAKETGEPYEDFIESFSLVVFIIFY